MKRVIPRISLSNFDERREEIKLQVFDAAVNTGFFTLCDQASPSVADIDRMFSLNQQYFALDEETKMKTPHQKLKNTGYESRAQIRPSSGTADEKESFQLQLHRINDNWPSAEDVGETWRLETEKFILKCHKLSLLLLEIFEESLGYPKGYFSKCHDISLPSAQSTLRLLHYYDTSGKSFPENCWRAAPHCDFDCLTLLFQRSGDHGLEVCPGREAHTDFGYGDEWTPVAARTGDIVINIGDMLMSWSDDKLKSNFHRVRMPREGENTKDRYTIAWFSQANKDVVIQGPDKKYPPTTGQGFIEDAMKRNFSK